MHFSPELTESSHVHFQSWKKILRCFIYSESAEGHMQDPLVIGSEWNSRDSAKLVIIKTCEQLKPLFLIVLLSSIKEASLLGWVSKLLIHCCFAFHNFPSPLDLFNWYCSTLEHFGNNDFECIHFRLYLIQIKMELVLKKPMPSPDDTEQSNLHATGPESEQK